ncbi:unnamed protein product [Triticum turgidum subsp. durum]|uniref:Uncharacterized protein n=1 Tax=Triticum turgidum subsp. durum TaxID=4567 RepID=A0A9R0WJH3_TRITD|nr:unnamed protein product [Triticum turgidum subsp. durum]
MASEDVVGQSRATWPSTPSSTWLRRPGSCVMESRAPPMGVDEDTKVEKAEFFYERGNFLANFLSAPATSASATSASGCPVMRGD